MNFQEGFLRVTGSSEIKLGLKSRPREILVEFLDEEIVPCNHHHHRHHHPDKLEWRVGCQVYRRSPWHTEESYSLEIKWNVESIRTIKWAVVY